MEEKIRKAFSSTIGKASNDPTSRARTFIISTASPDRDDDTIAASGWHLDNYRRNPVVLWAHDYDSLPIGKCTDIKVLNGQLVATALFADHELASTVLSLIDGGFLNATSVGFRPIATKPLASGGTAFTEQELLEFSVVPVPANPEALIVARSTMSALKGGWKQDWDSFTDIKHRSGFANLSIMDPRSKPTSSDVLTLEDEDVLVLDDEKMFGSLVRAPFASAVSDFVPIVRGHEQIDEREVAVLLREMMPELIRDAKQQFAMAVYNATTQELRRRGR
jgi:HK97 family phage prohead protease